MEADRLRASRPKTWELGYLSGFEAVKRGLVPEHVRHFTADRDWKLAEVCDAAELDRQVLRLLM
jgi:hypothetical protein